MPRFSYPYLKGEVDLTEERERHIAQLHPDLLPEHRDRMVETLADPDEVRRSVRFGSAKLFSRWYNDLQEGKHVVVVNGVQYSLYYLLFLCHPGCTPRKRGIF